MGEKDFGPLWKNWKIYFELNKSTNMIELPEFDKAFEYENSFYLSCKANRISKILAHYELYKLIQDVPGAIVECGVFKGTSFARFAMFRQLLTNCYSKKLVGFDTFSRFPETKFNEDIKYRDQFVQKAGDQSISTSQLKKVLAHKGINQGFELVSGDILETVPQYIQEHPELRISLLNLDTDIYEPAKAILEHLYPKITRGGILVLDDYGTFPGETQAVEEYFAGQNIEIKKFPFCMTPCYIVKP